MPKLDTLSVVDGYAEEIIKTTSEEVDNENEGMMMLHRIIDLAKSIRENVAVMKRYRELRKKPIYIFYPETDEYIEATKPQKIKIARRFLINEGRLDFK